MRRVLSLLFAAPLLLAGCGSNGKSCTITTQTGGSQALQCPDGTSTTIQPGANGSNGTSGTAATVELVSVVTEPAGKNCADGGKAIETGLDTNGNGTLDASEVTATAYVCTQPTATAPTTITGDVTIQNNLDVAALTGVTAISGTLTLVGAAGLASIALPSITHVGALTIDNPSPDGNTPGALTSLSLPALTTIDGALAVEDSGGMKTLDLSKLATVSSLTLSSVDASTLSFPALTTIGTGDLVIDWQHGGQSTIVSFPLLTQVGGDLDIDDSQHSVTQLSLPALTQVAGTISLEGLAITDFAQMNALESAAGFDIDELNALTTIDDLKPAFFSSVRGKVSITNNALLVNVSSLGGLVMPSALAFQGNIAVTELVLSGLVSVPTLTITGNDDLTMVSMPALVSAPELQVDFNASLTTFAVSSSFPVQSATSTFYAGFDPLLSTCALNAIAAKYAHASIEVTENDCAPISK